MEEHLWQNDSQGSFAKTRMLVFWSKNPKPMLERLDEVEVRFSEKHACCVILASRGYPEHYDKGFALTIPEAVRPSVFVAGAALRDGELVTSGGRVLGCTAVADTLPAAIREAYALAGQIHFENAYCRSDIGQRALRAKSEA